MLVGLSFGRYTIFSFSLVVLLSFLLLSLFFAPSPFPVCLGRVAGSSCWMDKDVSSFIGGGASSSLCDAEGLSLSLGGASLGSAATALGIELFFSSSSNSRITGRFSTFSSSRGLVSFLPLLLSGWGSSRYRATVIALLRVSFSYLFWVLTLTAKSSLFPMGSRNCAFSRSLACVALGITSKMGPVGRWLGAPVEYWWALALLLS